MLPRLIRWIGDGSMLQALKTKACARISNAIQQHPASAQAGDAYLLIRVEPSAPLNGVQKQFPESLPDLVPDVLGQIRLDPVHETRNAVRYPELAGHEQFNPVGPGRQDFYGWRCWLCRQGIAHQLHNRL